MGMQAFLTSGTFIVPAGVTTVKVRVWGGAGGAASGGQDGAAGGSSSFGSFCSATGGGGVSVPLPMEHPVYLGAVPAASST